MDWGKVRAAYLSLSNFVVSSWRNQSIAKSQVVTKKRQGLLTAKFKNIQGNLRKFNLGQVALRGILVFGSTFCVARTFIDQVGYPANVKGKSMHPEFNDYFEKRKFTFLGFSIFSSDWVWVSCWRSRNFNFQHGEIVVFSSPKEPYDHVIKRVIGLEGDTVITNRNIVLNSDIPDGPSISPVKIKIPEGHCWVEGDNWNNSADSHKYGPIPCGLIFGVATRIIWPSYKWKKLEPGIPEHLLPERVLTREPTQKPRSFWQKLKILFYFMSSGET